MIQVFYYKRTKKRIFLMAPLHHHFEKKGWSETKVVVRFWIVSGVLAAMRLLALLRRIARWRWHSMGREQRLSSKDGSTRRSSLGRVLVLGLGRRAGARRPGTWRRFWAGACRRCAVAAGANAGRGRLRLSPRACASLGARVEFGQRTGGGRLRPVHRQPRHPAVLARSTKARPQAQRGDRERGGVRLARERAGRALGGRDGHERQDDHGGARGPRAAGGGPGGQGGRQHRRHVSRGRGGRRRAGVRGRGVVLPAGVHRALRAGRGRASSTSRPTTCRGTRASRPMRPPSSGCWRTCLRFPARWPSWTPPTTWCAVPCAPCARRRLPSAASRTCPWARRRGLRATCARPAAATTPRFWARTARCAWPGAGANTTWCAPATCRSRESTTWRTRSAPRAPPLPWAWTRERSCATALAGFAPLEHRLEPCGVRGGRAVRATTRRPPTSMPRSRPLRPSTTCAPSCFSADATRAPTWLRSCRLPAATPRPSCASARRLGALRRLFSRRKAPTLRPSVVPRLRLPSPRRVPKYATPSAARQSRAPGKPSLTLDRPASFSSCGQGIWRTLWTRRFPWLRRATSCCFRPPAPPSTSSARSKSAGVPSRRSWTRAPSGREESGRPMARANARAGQGVPASIAGPRLIFLLAVMALLLVGFVMVYSASSVKAINGGDDPASFLVDQLLYAGLGIVCALVLWKFVPYRVWDGWLRVGDLGRGRGARRRDVLLRHRDQRGEALAQPVRQLRHPAFGVLQGGPCPGKRPRGERLP